MARQDENSPAAQDPAAVRDWRALLADIRVSSGKRYPRISRKMLNYLCSIGIAEAQRMLSIIDKTERDAAGQVNSNVPGLRISSKGAVLLSGAIFDLAAEHLDDEEIKTQILYWISEEKASFFSAVVGDPRSSMPEIVDAIRLYDDVLRGRSGLALSTLQSLRVSLVRRFLTDQLEIINMAKEVVRITDFIELVDRIIMPSGSYGKLGGKAAGLLMARWILEKSSIDAQGNNWVKTPRTWHIISDAMQNFVVLNHLDDVMEQKFKKIEQIRHEYPNLIQLFKNSAFPAEVITGLSRALDYFGEVPLIIRSSSLLEDRPDSAFSGKYKSLFLGNLGSKQERLDALVDAVAEVWASILGPDPIEYRRERGLQEFSEEMGILIQEVIGTRIGHWWLPAFAGVAFSQNEIRWSPRIQREDGLVRIVPGLGTRAVDRIGDDFPIVAVLTQPDLRANSTTDEVLRYCPIWADVINLNTNRFETVQLTQVLKEAGSDYPLIEKIFSIFKDGTLRKESRLMMNPETDTLIADMAGLLTDTDFIPRVHSLLTTLQNYLGTAVEIEFAHDGENFYLLQCRPQVLTGSAAPAQIPRNIADEDLIFSAQRFVTNGLIANITHLVYVDPGAYSTLPSVEEMKRVGQAVGRLNKILPRRRFILIGPGRWGSRGDITLGVNVSYADINNTAMLIEVAHRRGNYIPDLSFGTHFFQDLVESDILYLPLYPDDDGVAFNSAFLSGTVNILPSLLPEYQELQDCVRVIDVAAVSGGRNLHIFMNADIDRAVAVLADADYITHHAIQKTATATLQGPCQHWRWRFSLTERMVRELDSARFGVEAVYLIGSVKTGTAGPASDINLLVHFRGDENQRRSLDLWFDGWSLAMSEMLFLQIGLRVEKMLDITYLSDADIADGTGVAARIGATVNAARPLSLS
ncbi:nucleotidyltransferase domain-containing protein [bacterium]|nr:nucleotidyltransferase domain-containing protein [bacterium]